jgi:signal transduction histidine kinase
MDAQDRAREDVAPAGVSLESPLVYEEEFRSDDAHQAVADKALRERPSFSIRARLILVFSLFFMLPLTIALWTIDTLSEVQDKIVFLEAADDYKVEIQQARRFEKNFLLYGTNLEDARDHARQAQQLASRHADRFRRVVGLEAQQQMVRRLDDYLQALEQVTDGNRTRSENALREHGAEMVRLAQRFVDTERRQVHSKLTLIRRVPLYFLGALLVITIVAVTGLARHIVRTLDRFRGYTERIALGDFTPITPTRWYRDEFSQLELNINRMVRELDRHHRIQVESHKLRALGTLVAGVAHELNNPVNNILLTASLLREEGESLPAAQRTEMYQDLVAQSERTRRIVSNLLDYVRRRETTTEALEVRTLLEETLHLVNNQIRVKKVHLTMDLPGILPPVHGDRQLLSQIFMNLILNALDVLPEGGEIRIHSGVERQDGFIVVNVSDNGPGIPEHIIGRIFDPFFTTKPRGTGTGLGLFVARSIVRRMGGNLHAKSRPGQGTTFTVLLPITTVPSGLVTRNGHADAPPGPATAADPGRT